MTWREYVAALTAQNAAWARHWAGRFGDENSWLDTLPRLRAIGAGPLASLTNEDRRILAGARVRKVNPAFFGDLSAAGVANGHILCGDDRAVLAVLDEARGAVRDVGDPLTIDAAMAAFERITALSGFGFAVASRVLGALRPDVYVVLNNASLPGINKVLADPFPNNRATPANLARYRALLESVRRAPWWGAPRPPDADAELWDGRALLLDTFFYDESVG